ncbi:hypothetical protein LX32DRAFT_666543 [Colletotrichum zoysiae]|uniref:CorA-like Mg2+ transporter n=1 Tax=Colletotrichum zoysiae TaxID=1216348 RepID=A0AAD9H908_9PEZI|nr:hypothetical protein LX32DRAFT_666543 [Colletotrichum zoysiae]
MAQGDDETTTLNLILFRRTSKTFSECPPEIQYLPVSKSTFQKVTDSFQTHRSLARMVNRKDAEFLHCVEVDHCCEPQKLVYNYRTSVYYGDDVAVSVTHEPLRRSTTAIFFGLSEAQESLLLYRMKQSPEDFCHPLALVGAACELDRDRWIIKEVRPIERTYAEKNDQWSTTSSENLAADPEGETMEDTLDLRFKSSYLLTELTAARRQLARIGDHLREVRRDPGMVSFLKGPSRCSDKETETGGCGMDLGKQQAHTAGRLQHRLNQIADEFDMKIDSCKSSMEDMMATTQVVISRIARHDTQTNTAISVATREDSSQMRSIAFVTMIFLPVTSIATIFSMNVFDWQAKDGEHLITVHFWLYLAVAGASTALTVGLWVFYTRMRKELSSRKDEEVGV